MTTTDPERDENDLLLPWHVTGRLDRAEATRLEAALARDPDDLDAKEGIATADRSRSRPSMATRQGKDRTASFEPPTC